MALIGNRIIIGEDLSNPDYYFENDEIIKVNGEFSVSLIDTELSIDTLTPEVSFEVIPPMIFKPTNYDGILTRDEYVFRGKHSSDIRDLKYGTKIWYFSSEDRMVGKYYLKNIEQVGKKLFVLNCFSSIGLLDKADHYGGVYINSTFEDVMDDIMRKDTKPSHLPYRYAEVKNIANLQNQYIDTGFHPTSETKVTIKCKPIVCENVSMVCGVRNSTNGNSFGCGFEKKVESSGTNYYGKPEYGKLEQMTTKGTAIAYLSTECEIILNHRVLEEKEDPETHEVIIEEHRYLELHINGSDEKVDILPVDTMFEALDSTLYLFATNYGNIPSDIFIGSISRALIEVNDSVVHEYVPCVDRKTHSVGMYDIVEDKFYGNSGSTDFDFSHGEYVDPISDGTIVPYKIADELKNLPVRGWLPKDTKRNNLQKLLFSYNVNVKKTENGDPYFVPLLASNALHDVNVNHIYCDGTINYGTAVSEVEVQSHGLIYESGEEIIEIFDNESEPILTTEKYVSFSKYPICPSTITWEHLTVLRYNCNGAYITGNGKIKGVPYKDYIYTDNAKNEDAYEDNIVTADTNTLISSINSTNVAERLISYYKDAKIVRNNIVMTDEDVGNMYKIVDPFDEEREIFLAKVSMNASSNIKAACDMITGYKPSGGSGIYSHSILLTGEGEWETPQEILDKGEDGEFLAIIFQGGSGGDAGSNGNNGSGRITIDSDEASEYSGGEGGNGGKGGIAGKVLIQLIKNPERSYIYNCGSGGHGGEKLGKIDKYWDLYSLPMPSEELLNKFVVTATFAEESLGCANLWYVSTDMTNKEYVWNSFPTLPKIQNIFNSKIPEADTMYNMKLYLAMKDEYGNLNPHLYMGEIYYEKEGKTKKAQPLWTKIYLQVANEYEGGAEFKELDLAYISSTIYSSVEELPNILSVGYNQAFIVSSYGFVDLYMKKKKPHKVNETLEELEYEWINISQGIYSSYVISGRPGTETTFGSYSSRDGTVLQNGYLNFSTGEIYGLSGKNGVRGGDGARRNSEKSGVISSGQDVFYNGVTYHGGKKGTDVTSSYGIAEGGYGGGASAGSSGKNGRKGYYSSYTIVDPEIVSDPTIMQDPGICPVFIENLPGYGGFGGDAIDPKGTPLPGAGGNGGNGGGGGGQGGFAKIGKKQMDPVYFMINLCGSYDHEYEVTKVDQEELPLFGTEEEKEDPSYVLDYTDIEPHYSGGGLGGQGSNGGDGGPGAVLIFW